MAEKEIIWAGQTKYRGDEIEDAVRWWQERGINHLMVKKNKSTNMPLLDPQGVIIEENFERLGLLQGKYGCKFHLHPYELFVGDKRLTSSLKSTQKILADILIRFDYYIQEYKLYPLITIHPPRMEWPDNSLGFSEEQALENSLDFFQRQLSDVRSRIALENMHYPFRNPGHALLGFRAEHFTKLISDKSFGLCIDVGHALLADEPLQIYIDLPFPIYSVHLHGNDKTDDQHLLPTTKNVGDVESVKLAIRKCEGPVVFEIRDNDSDYEVQKCVSFWQGSIK